MDQQGSARILVVDDDPTIGKLLNIVLLGEGHQPVLASSGEAALQLVSRMSLDMGILDVMLPGMDGYALCRALRQNPTTSFMPIVILTAQAETRDKLAGFRAGADDYLTKPFEPPELLYRVRALLGRGNHAGAEPKPLRQGQVWIIFGAKGGVGKTTIAVNLAVALAKLPDTHVALMDADFSFGNVGAHLDLFPSRTILDLAPRIDELDDELLSKVLLHHSSGVHVLLGPYHPEDAERISPEALSGILLALRQNFDFVLVDCAANYDERTLLLLEGADKIVMILTPEIGPVKNTSAFLDLADKLEIPTHKVQFVLNRAGSEVGIAAPEIERALQKPIPMQLVSGGRPIVLSVNRGVPFLLEQPKHPFSQQILRIADQLRTPMSGAARS